MVFIETPIFTDDWDRIGKYDEALAELQTALMVNPEVGNPIPRSGGLRKIRVAAKGKGKRGGARVIYYWHRGDGQIFLLLTYPKNELDDLTTMQLRELRDLAAE